MRRVIVGAAAAALSASFVWGALGDVVASFQAPANYPIALAVPRNHWQYLWVYCNSYPYRIYRIRGDNGSLYSSYVSPCVNSTRGLTYSYNGGGGLPTGSYLWIGNTANDYVYRCDYFTGSVYASFHPYYNSNLSGLAVQATDDGGESPTCMISSNASLDRVYLTSFTNGICYNLWSAYTEIYDLAWDWRNGIIWTGLGGDEIYGYDRDGSLVESFDAPADYVIGFAYTSNYLWVSTTIGSHRIWKVHCPELADHTNIVPSSVGRIKATYR